MSLGGLVGSAHQISITLAEMYGDNILEGPPRLAVNAPSSSFNFPKIPSFNNESGVSFAIDFSGLRITPFLFKLSERDVQSLVSSHILRAFPP